MASIHVYMTLNLKLPAGHFPCQSCVDELRSNPCPSHFPLQGTGGPDAESRPTGDRSPTALIPPEFLLPDSFHKRFLELEQHPSRKDMPVCPPVSSLSCAIYWGLL